MNKPAWPALDEADNLEMLRWLDIQLNDIHFEEAYDVCHRSPFTEAEHMAYAIERAEAGDIRSLRDEFVRITNNSKVGRFVNLPKLKRGQHWSVNSSSLIGRAAADVSRIRKLWFEHYGKRRRRQSDGWSAEMFAAEIWTVDVDQIERYLKKH